MKKQLFFIILLGVVELLAGCRPEGTGNRSKHRVGPATQTRYKQFAIPAEIPDS